MTDTSTRRCQRLHFLHSCHVRYVFDRLSFTNPLLIELGFTESERPRAGQLYWSAFGAKLRSAFGDEDTGAEIVTQALHPERVLAARSGGELVGLCGFYQGGRGAADLTWPPLRSRLGALGALRALLVLRPLARRPRSGVLVMDGICVAQEHRGQGVGSALLTAVLDHARSRGDSAVQLSVIDSNPRAEALYRRTGFEVVSEGSLGPLSRLYGFESYLTMQRPVR
ncbi:MAG: GNAT family N-acetyltransferase [Beutenbergiaceae bacterium]